MLEELRIRDFAIIEDLTLQFSSGLVVFTGETGAGKSIILDEEQQSPSGRFIWETVEEAIPYAGHAVSANAA